MKISVVVPTRNRSHLLAQALAGIHDQSHAELDLIVVDDGSTQQEAARNEELTRAAREGARYVYLDGAKRDGSGPSVVRNAGLERASGPLIAFCDDDDFWCEPDYLAAAAAAFARHPDLDLVLANQRALRDGVPAYEVWQPGLLAAIGVKRGVAGDGVVVGRGELLGHPGKFAHLNVCVLRKSLVEALGGFRREVRYAEDMDLYVRYLDRMRRAFYLDRTVAVHNIPDRNRADNSSSRLTAEDGWVVVHGICSYLMLHCDTKEARNYAARLAGGVCRDLALSCRAAGNYALAHRWARVAGAWWPTTKWSVFTALLGTLAWAGSRQR
ncbi:glycosyltransferase family 2 protein [Thiomonas sp. FB-6]|uniref:glycosyltransferase family 2 protein n=1 Tax=Thiomonas sp. FB-6 TaxID=1158291 RepID=UPI000373CDA8|nr:glycosyltransferase family 2 protein [Thiomonas sp. FB-6]